MVKRTLILVLALISTGSLTTIAQSKANFGVFAGTAYYMGDINPNRHFYRPSVSFGVLYRFNINKRIALRVSAYYAKLSGSDTDFPEILHPDRPISPASFHTSLIDNSLQIEYNFLPYMPGVDKWAYTPYITTGIAASLIFSSDVSATNHASLPFGIGMKINLSSRMSAGAEWSFRKTFSDRVDGIENPSGTTSFLHNNDWYSFLGVFITFKFFNFVAECPAYK